MTREIPLTKGLVALVDDADHARVSARKWHAAVMQRSAYARNGHEFLHRFILSAPAGLEVDHINGDGLDNRRSNLRLATRQQNSANSAPHPKPRGHSRFRGVSRYTRPGYSRWMAYITVSGKHIRLGYFTSEEEAARCYDAAARKHFGAFARPNFQEGT